MREASIGIQDQLRAMAVILTAVRERLAGLSASLPEEDGELEAEATGPGLRSVVECILADSVEPAIRDLLAAAGSEGEPAALAAKTSRPRSSHRERTEPPPGRAEATRTTGALGPAPVGPE